jgi:multidrug resistance protein, MATE family
MKRLSYNIDTVPECALVESLEFGIEDEQIHSFDKAASTDSGGFHLWSEMMLLLQIAAPSVVVQFSILFIFPRTASVVGRTLGTNELAAFSLGSLTGNLTIQSITTGALTAADTLMPRAFAAGKFSDMGILAIRGFIVCCVLLLIPVVPLCTSMEWVFDKLGQDKVASAMAAQWIRAYLFGVLPLLVFRVIQSFLNAQHQVWPMVFSSVLASYIVHPIFLKYLVPAMGETGSALAISLTQWVMAGSLLLFLRFRPVYKHETWVGLSKQSLLEALSPKPMTSFMNLSLGGVLSLSEWWFWETCCFIVGSFGVVPLVVHTIAYNLVPLLFMPTLGISIGLTVRMGHLIAYDARKAKFLAAWCMLFTTLFGAGLMLCLYQYGVPIVMLFTDDEVVIQGCQHIWPNLCYFIFVLQIFGINAAILRALGKQWDVAAIMFGCLWFAALPSIVYFAMYRQGGLEVVWIVLPISYTIMQFFMAGSYICADWYRIGKEVHDRTHGEGSHKIFASKEESGKLLRLDEDDNDNEN